MFVCVLQISKEDKKNLYVERIDDKVYRIEKINSERSGLLASREDGRWSGQGSCKLMIYGNYGDGLPRM